MPDEIKILTEQEIENVSGGNGGHVSGGNGGHIEYIICPTCGYEIRLKGWYTNICPRCKAIVKK